MMIRFVLGLIIIVFAHVSFAENYDVSQLDEIVPVNQLMLLPEQRSGSFSVDEIGQVSETLWVKIVTPKSELTLPVGTTWLKFNLKNHYDKAKNVYFILDNHSSMAGAQFYAQSNNRGIQSLNVELSNTNFYYGDLFVAPFSEQTIYIRIESDIELKNRLSLMGSNQFTQLLSEHEYLFGIAIGGMVLLSIVVWILFLASRDKLLGILASYFTVRTLFLATLLGTNLFYVYGGDPDVRGFELPILAAFNSYLYLWFASELFKLKKTAPKLHRITVWVRLSTLALLPVAFLYSVNTNFALGLIVSSCVMVYMLSLGLYLTRKGRNLALTFSIVIFIHLLLTIIIGIGARFQFELFYEHELFNMVSFWLNALLLVFLMSRLYAYQLKDKQQAQLEALEYSVASQQAQENLIRLQEKSQEELEQRVQERTLELNIALSELESANEELERKNTIDELTSLYNRRFYDQKIMAEYRRSKRNLQPLSLVILDIDFFKDVNDHHGHLAGDQCLVWLAQHIKNSIKRSTDMACRYGGEEFALILPDTDKDGAIAFAESIRTLIEQEAFNYQEQSIPLTVSCGVSTYLKHKDESVKDLFLAADKALYQAKRHGRNQVQYLAITPESNT